MVKSDYIATAIINHKAAALLSEKTSEGNTIYHFQSFTKGTTTEQIREYVSEFNKETGNNLTVKDGLCGLLPYPKEHDEDLLIIEMLAEMVSTVGIMRDFLFTYGPYVKRTKEVKAENFFTRANKMLGENELAKGYIIDVSAPDGSKRIRVAFVLADYHRPEGVMNRIRTAIAPVTGATVEVKQVPLFTEKYRMAYFLEEYKDLKRKHFIYSQCIVPSASIYDPNYSPGLKVMNGVHRLIDTITSTYEVL